MKERYIMTSKNKIIFLDFDGVVNNISESGLNITLPLYSSKRNKESGLTKWSTDNIPHFIRLLELCKENEWKIVISSTWRLFTDRAEDFNNYFKKYFKATYNIKLKDYEVVIGVTPRLNGVRGKEILKYIEENKVEDYIVIDDDIFDIVDYIKDEKIVHIDIKTGLTAEDIKNIEKNKEREYTIKVYSNLFILLLLINLFHYVSFVFLYHICQIQMVS